MRGMSTRLMRAEKVTQALPSPSAPPKTDADYLAQFEELLRADVVGDPDFPEAISDYRRAIASSDAQAYQQRKRAWLFCCELIPRALDRIPPVGAVEWQSLSLWLDGHKDYLLTLPLMQDDPVNTPWVWIGGDYLRHLFHDGRKQHRSGRYAVLARAIVTQHDSRLPA